MEIAPFGHTGSQTSQLMHWSVILRAIFVNARSAACRAPADLVAHALDRERMHEGGDVAAEDRDLAHDSRREEEVLVGRRQEQSFDTRGEAPVHARELELVLEVGDRT